VVPIAGRWPIKDTRHAGKETAAKGVLSDASETQGKRGFSAFKNKRITESPHSGFKVLKRKPT